MMNDRRRMYFYIILYVLSLKWKYVMNCGGTYTNPSGEIMSPGYPAAHSSNMYCLYTIRLAAGKRIHLKWEAFYAPGKMPQCTGGYVRITRCSSPLKYLIRYCGDTFPNDIYSYGNCIRVDFRSRSLNEKFKLRYETLDASKPLFPNYNNFTVRNYGDRESMNIYSPNWPLTYSGLLTPSGCTTRVTLKKNRKMKILFMGIDLPAPQQSSSLCWADRNDALEFRGVGTDGGHYSYNFCGKQKSFTKFYDTYFRYVDFNLKLGSNQTHNHTGFVIGIVFFEDIPGEEEEEGLSGSARVAAIVVPIAVVLILLWLLHSKATQSGGCRALIDKTREDMRRRNDNELQSHDLFTAGLHTLPAPPPYPPPSYAVISTYGQSEESKQLPPPTSNMSPPTSATAPQMADMPPPYTVTPYNNAPGYDVSYQPGEMSLPPVYNTGR